MAWTVSTHQNPVWNWLSLLMVVAAGSLHPLSARANNPSSPHDPADGRTPAIQRTPEGRIVVNAATYAAVLDPQGHLTSLVVAGVELLNGRADAKPFRGGIPFPQPRDAPPATPSIEIRDHQVTLARGDVRVRYRFLPDALEIATAGASLEWWLGPSVELFIVPGVQSVQGQKGGMGNITRMIAGPAVVTLSQPYHRVGDRMFPSGLASGSFKPADPFTVRLTFGGEVPPEELLSSLTLSAEGFSPFVVPQFPAGADPTFSVSVTGHQRSPLILEHLWNVVDHYHAGNTLAQGRQTLTLPPGQTAAAQVKIPLPPPGFYWLESRLLLDGKPVRQAQRGWISRPADYRPSLTRPADFKEFWEQQVRAMRAIPFDAKLTEQPHRSTDDAVWHEIEMTVAGGKRLAGIFTHPRRPGKYLGQFSEIRKEVSQKQYDRWKTEAGGGVFIGLPWPDVADFRRWTARDDNNMLDCYLLAIRMADFLRSRPEVDRLLLRGASRSGPLALVAAALDPERVLYVDAHVPTSMGVSWSDKRYRGWGERPGEVADAKWADMAPYMDPLNFAPDLRVPFILDGGISDNLAPAPGILAFHNHAEHAPFKRVSIENGGHGYFSSNFRKTATSELRRFVGLDAPEPAADKPANP